MVNQVRVGKVSDRSRPHLIFRKSTFQLFSAKMVKHEKYRVLLAFDDLSKNVKNDILTYNEGDK